MTLPTGIPSPPESWQVLDLRRLLLDAVGVDIHLDLRLHAYAVCLLLAMVAAGVITDRRLTRRGGEPGLVVDIALWTIGCGIVGARVWHVVTHPDDYFSGQSPWEVLQVWEGGIAIFGSLVGGAVGAWVGCRRAGVRYAVLADALAPGLLVAQAVGRLGNWFNHELFGGPTTLPWGLRIEADNPAYPDGVPAGTLVHPAFLYEMVWNLVGVAVVLLVAREVRLTRRGVVRRPLEGGDGDRPPFGNGRVLGLYLVWYGAGRFLIESLRLDPAETVLGLRSNHWAALLAVAVGAAVVVLQRGRPVEPGVYLPGREPAPPSAPDDRASEPAGDDATVATEDSAATQGRGAPGRLAD